LNLSRSEKPELKVDWCSYQAAKYAVEHWHYSKTIPVSKRNNLGIWEDGKFIGCVIFALGASPSLGLKYNLTGLECSELVRVALDNHITPVTKIISIALKYFKHHNPNIRLIVSFADTYHGHHGGIYQGGNWLYSGKTSKSKMVKLPDGRLTDLRRYNGHGDGKVVGGKIWKQPKRSRPNGSTIIITPGKHRYLMPLDRKMRKQIEPLRKPYPKKPHAEVAT
jgi:hypothetical protein